MAKQTRTGCNLKNLHKELVDNCKQFIVRLNQSEQTMTVGHVHQQASQAVSGTTSGGIITINTEVNSEELRILTHAFMIQEWHLFLENVFEKTVNYNLLNKRMPKFQKMVMKIDFEDVDLSTGPKARIYVCDKLKRTFSFESYDEKIAKTRKLVDLQNFTNELHFIKKNVIVRNIFQHQKGIVSSHDLERLGGKLSLLDDNGSSISFKNKSKLTISKAEINELYEKFKKITQNLQVI